MHPCKARYGTCSVVENVRFHAPKLTIDFLEALYDSIRTDLRLIEALKSLTIESRHLLDHCQRLNYILWVEDLQNPNSFEIKSGMFSTFHESNS